MQLCLDAADRLVELVEERRGPVPVEEAARAVLKLQHAVPVGLARSLLEEAVAADGRLRFAGDLVSVAGNAGEGMPLEQATFVVFDLETTGLTPGTARPCEIGAVRVRALELDERFQTLANPGARLQPAIAALTGLRDEELRRAPPVAAAVRSFLGFAGEAVLVAHNARFDIGVPRRRDASAPGRGASMRPSSTRSASRADCSGASRRTCPHSRIASRPPHGRATARCPTPRRPPRSCSA